MRTLRRAVLERQEYRGKCVVAGEEVVALSMHRTDCAAVASSASGTDFPEDWK